MDGGERMKQITSMKSQWQAVTKSGESLNFKECRGGYFSDDEEYGLKLIGKTFQDGTPSIDNPIEIQCVKAGSKITCGDCEIVVPCDLYEGDIWYPNSGEVIKASYYYACTGNEKISNYQNRVFIMWFEDYVGKRRWDSITCSHLNKLSFSNNTRMGIAINFADIGIESTTTVTEFKRWLKEKANNNDPIIFVYEVETPVTEQYDPQPISPSERAIRITQVPKDLSGTIEATVISRR